MEMTGEQLIPVAQKVTWDALNNPDVLKACVPGCDSIEKISESEYVVAMTSKIGPVSAKFKGKLMLSDIDPPNGYSMSFEGQGGVAGFARGTASVSLAPDGAGTKLSYTAKATVGGKLAQIGSRLIDGAARKVAEQFFSAFNKHLSGGGS